MTTNRVNCEPLQVSGYALGGSVIVDEAGLAETARDTLATAGHAVSGFGVITSTHASFVTRLELLVGVTTF